MKAKEELESILAKFLPIRIWDKGLESNEDYCVNIEDLAQAILDAGFIRKENDVWSSCED